MLSWGESCLGGLLRDRFIAAASGARIQSRIPVHLVLSIASVFSQPSRHPNEPLASAPLVGSQDHYSVATILEFSGLGTASASKMHPKSASQLVVKDRCLRQSLGKALHGE